MKRPFVPLVLVAMSGCTVVTKPGFEYVDPAVRPYVELGTQVRHSPASVNSIGRITPINEELIRTVGQNGEQRASVEVMALFAAPKPYTIGPSDVLQIGVYDHPELAPIISPPVGQPSDPTGISPVPGFIVNAEGLINYPFIGRVKLAGLDEVTAAELLQQRLSRFIKDPQVTVRIASFRSRRAYIEGEVRSPGMQVFTDVPMTLVEAINRAGGITQAGDRSNVRLTRGSKTIKIDIQELLDSGMNPGAILLEPGDVINVRSRDESKVFVLGEATRPSALQMRNGRLTLNEALGEVGGPSPLTSNPAQVYVIRPGSGPRDSSIYHLNASSPTALVMAEAFPLKPRDVVYIDPIPLVNWSRIINLILPSAQALSASRSALN